MDEIAVKSVIIGVSIFITTIITTIVIAEFFQISQIYKSVGETDVSFESKFDEFNKFNDSNNEFNGLDVRNYINKYKSDKRVEVCVDGQCEDINVKSICDTKENISGCSDNYIASLETTNIGYRIIFETK